jgi:tetratricopeptide (TPR) repeat protein/tRNA A-37 threonylcarbamoyl transferase component Bud32
MDPASRNSVSRETLLDEAVVAYLEAAESGSPPSPETWIARYPEIAGELAEFFADQAKIARWTAPLQVGKGSTAADDPDQTAASGGMGPRSRESGALDDYDLLQEIAHGGMGVVYKARQVSLNRVVALKMIRAGRLASPTERQRFRLEAEAVASLDHPHIMPIYEVGEHRGRPYFSMKYIDGGSLAEQLPRFADDPRGTARFIAAVARAVHHAHQRGILHRDLKPANILIDQNGQPYVTDFGLAGRVEGDSGITQSGAIVGTPSFMAPEQAAGQKGLSTAADIFSLGAILYTMAAGQSPFHAPTPLEAVRRVLDDEPTRPRLLNPKLDRDLETICLKCLQKEPDRRYRSAEALAEDLERWLAGEPIHARRSPLWERGWKKVKRNPKAAALLCFVLLLVSVGAYSFLNQLARAEERQAHTRQLRGEAEEDMLRAEIAKAQGNLEQTKLLLEKAMAKASADPDLSDLLEQIKPLLEDADRRVNEVQARRDAQEMFRQFSDRRNDAVFLGTLYTGVDAPSNITAMRHAAEEAMRRVGMTPTGGDITEDRHLFDDEKMEITAGCYELLLTLAEAEAQSSPPHVEEAIQLLDRARWLGPVTKAYHMRRARYLALLGDDSGAAAEQSEAAELDATGALDHFLLGEDLRRQDDVAGAIREFERILQDHPDHFWAHYLLAICHLQTEPRAAKAHLTACLSQRPQFGWCYLQRGIAHGQLKELAAAEEDFARALAFPPEDARLREELRYAVLVYRGLLRMRHGTPEESAEDFVAAIAIKEHPYQAHWNLAVLHQSQGDLAAAAVQFQAAIDAAEARIATGELAPDSIELATLYQTRAHFHQQQQNRSAALDDLDQAIRVRPLAESFALRGQVLQQLEQFAEAAAAYQEALQITPADPIGFSRGEIHDLRARALAAIEQFPEARHALDLAIAESEHPAAEVYRLRGIVRAKVGDFPGAVEDYTHAISLAPDDPLSYEYRGRVYLIQEAFGPAWDDFGKAISLNPAGGEAYNGRAYIHARRGKPMEAIRDAEEALRRERRRNGETAHLLWTAAMVHGLAVGALDADHQRGKLQGGRIPEQYRARAVELLRQAVNLIPTEKRAAFWRSNVQPEAAGAFASLAQAPEYAEMEKALGGGE